MQKWLSLKKWAYVIHCLGQGSVTKTRILPQWFRAESTRLQGAEWLTEAQAGTGEADTRMSFWQQFPKLTRPVRGLLPPLQPQGRWLQHHTTTAKMENIVTKKLPPSESHNDQEVVWLQRRSAPTPGSPCPAMTSQMCALHPACQSSRSRRLEPALLIPSPAGQRLHRPVSRNSRHSRNLANGRPKRAFELSQLCCAGRGSRSGGEWMWSTQSSSPPQPPFGSSTSLCVIPTAVTLQTTAKTCSSHCATLPVSEERTHPLPWSEDQAPSVTASVAQWWSLLIQLQNLQARYPVVIQELNYSVSHQQHTLDKTTGGKVQGSWLTFISINQLNNEKICMGNSPNFNNSSWDQCWHEIDRW